MIFEVDINGELAAVVDGLALPPDVDEADLLAEVYGVADQTSRWERAGNGRHLAAGASDGLGG